MQNLQFINEEVFVGMNDKLRPEYLKTGWCADAKNAIFDRGFIDKRTGYTMIANDLGSKRGLGLGGFRSSTGATKHLMAAFDNSGGSNAQLYYWPGSGNHTLITGSDIFTADTNVNFEMAAAKIYAYNGVDSVQSWNGSSRATVAAIPIVKCMKWFHNYMFAFNNPTYPSRLYFSNLTLPETWGASDYIDINPDDGDYGTALAVLGDELILGKRNRVWSFTGWGETTWDVKTINERVSGYGFVNHRAVVNVGNDLYYLSFVGDIPVVRSLLRTRYATVVAGGVISDDVEGTMRGLSKAQLEGNACSAFDGLIVWFFVPNGSSTYNDLGLRYNTETKGWTRHTGINASCALTFVVSNLPEIYLGESQADSKVYKMDSSYSDNGAAIDWEFTGRKHQPSMAKKNKWKYLFAIGEEGTNTTVDVQASPDGISFESLGELDLKMGEGIFPMDFSFILGATDVVRERFNAKYTSYGFQVKFANDTELGPVGIRGYSLYHKPRSLRDA